jgi:predicted CoA-substrate-specific enzyme activase
MYCGVDIGARSIEVVLFDGAQVIESGVADSGISPRQNASKLFREVLSTARVHREHLRGIISTGYGRNYFEGSHRAVSEILCHARGVLYFFPGARTVIDIGGQDSKLIVIDEAGRVVDFVMNDRCAAGTGRFIEMVAHTAGIDLEDLNTLVAEHFQSVEVSSMCAVFAESEIVGLLQGGTPVPTILNGVFRAIAKRTSSMAGRSTVLPALVFTGGVARLEGVARALKGETGLEPLIPHDPQITGALGAAMIASESATDRT